LSICCCTKASSSGVKGELAFLITIVNGAGAEKV
jgi:hypothetical protein